MTDYSVANFDKGLVVGDIITAYQKGYWRVTAIEVRYEDGPGSKQMNSLIRYQKVMNEKMEFVKPTEQSCDAYYCNKVTAADIKEVRERISNALLALEAMC